MTRHACISKESLGSILHAAWDNSLSGTALIALLCLTGCSKKDADTADDGRILDSFVKLERSAELDILWVLDSSGSATDEQAMLVAAVGSYLDQLSLAGVPYRIGVTTADMAQDIPGSLVGDLLDQDTSDLAASFAAQLQVSGGDTVERGMDAMVEALDPDGPNGQLARDDADLEVIVFSDEDDASRLEPDETAEALAELRPGMSIGVNVISGDLPDGCASLAAAADPAERYAELAELTRGRVESICTPDYESMLARIAYATLGIVDTFQLSATPDLAGISVRVDGATVEESAQDGWQYHPGYNAIVFDGAATPPPGASVDINYNEWYGF